MDDSNKKKLYGVRINQSNLLDNASKPDKRFNIGQFFVIFLILLLGFLFLYFNDEITGLVVYEEPISLGVNNFVSNESYIVVNVGGEDYLKNINEFDLEFVNGTVFIEDLVINLSGLGLGYGNYDLNISLFDNGSLISSYSDEITIGLFEVEEDVGDVVIEDITEEVNESSLEEPVVEDVKIKKEKVEKDVTEIIEEENVTIIENVTEDIFVNETIGVNITEDINETVVIENVTEDINFTVETIQGKAEINKKVKWIKKIKLEYESDNLTLDLDDAENVSIKEKGKEIIFTKVENKIKIKEKIKDIELVYHTRGPLVYEEDISPYKKYVTVYSDIHYEDILAYTNISEFEKDRVKLYWLINGSRVLVDDVRYIDSNNNSLIDQIEWNVPHLSNQTYEISITILNVQSYPTVGGNWTVMFNTTGEADLIIKTSDETTWSDVNEDNDLKFLEVKCGDSILDYEWVNDGVFISNYSCGNIGYETSKVLTSGVHTLMFEFGGQIAYAYNDATISDCQTLGTDNEYYTLDSDTTANYDSNCFTVTGSNITLDCAGYTIDGNGDADGYGVIINNAAYDGLTIKNCIIQEFNRNIYVGRDSDNIRIENSSLINGYNDGILTYSTDNMYIVNSNFSGVNAYGGHFLVTGGDNNNNNWTVINSTFKGGDTGSTNYGVNADYIYNATFENNNFLGGHGTSQDWGMRIDYADGSVFRNNIFEGGSTSTYDRAFYLRYGEGVIFENNIFLSHRNGYPAVDVAYASNSNWDNNSFTHETNNYGLYYQYSDNVTISNSNLSSVTSIGLRLHGVNNSLIENTTATSGTSYGGYFANDNYYNTFKNNDFSGAYAMYQAYSDENIFENNNFTSTTQYTYIRFSDYNNYTNNNFSSIVYGVYMLTDNIYNNFEGNTISSNTNHGLYIYQNSTGTRLISNNISGGSYGIYFANSNDGFDSNNVEIVDNNVKGVTYAMYIQRSKNPIIENNTLLGPENRLGLDRVYHTAIRNHNFNGTQAMYQLYSDNNTLENNNFTSTTSYTYIIYSNNNTYEGNNFTSSSSYGMWLRYTSSDNTFNNNIFQSTSNYGAYIREDSMRNNFTSNNFRSTSSFGARFYDNNDNNKIFNNNFSSDSNWALYMDIGNDNNVFENNNITSAGTGALALLTNSNNNSFNNCSFISGTTADDDALYIATSSNNNRFSNSTILGDRFGLYINNADGNIIEDSIINSTGSSNADGDAIYLYFTPKSNVIRRNKVQGYRFPVYMLYGAQYNNLTSNNFISETADFRLNTACDNNLIENNSIASGSANTDYGIYMLYSDGNTIRNNNITSGDHGLYIYSSSNNIVDNNNISVLNIAGSYGIYMYLFSNDNNIINNKILAQGDDNIRIQASLSNLFENNTLCNSGDYGFYIYEGSEGNVIRENNICDNTDDGIYILSSNDNKIISNNLSGNTNGVTVIDSIWNKLEGNEIRDNGAAGLNFGDATTGSSTFVNGEIIDNSISNSGTNDIVLVASTIDAINLSYDETKVSIDVDSSATFKWWVDVNVTDRVTQVQNATVNIYDNVLSFIDQRSTGVTGYVIKANLTEYYEDINGRTYYSNYTFNASANNYFDSSISYNITSNTIINITLIESLPPVLQSIILSPSSSDDIDPNVQINVTADVTDYIAVSTVILQYKENNNTEWVNNSMIYDSNARLFTNGLFTPNNNNTLNYRIWANDTDGNSNFSISYDVDVQYDYSWNRTPSDLGTVIGILNTVGTMGNLTINNTGDFNLTIDLSSTWTDTTYTVTEPFVVQPKEVIIVKINVTFDNQITDVNSKITVDASGNQPPDPLQLNTTVLISSYTGGPYLELTLYTYPTTAWQTSIEPLKAKIQNLAKYASETIYNITLNWSLPIEGWAVLSGNLTINFTNLTAQSIDYANLSVLISTSSPYDINGTNTTISVSAVTDSNTTGGVSVNVVLLCNGADGVCGEGCWDDVDADCVGVSSPPAGGSGSTSTSGGSGGGGGGGGSVSSSRALKLKESTQTVEILKGESSQFNLDIENIYPNSILKDVTIDVEGFLKQYINIEPKTISEIGYKEKNQFIVSIEVPTYFNFGTYQLETTISGNLVKNGVSQILTERRMITLIVHEITEDVALEALAMGEKIVKEMKNDGFKVILISRMLDDAKIAYENKQYKKTKDIVDGIIEKEELAYEAKELITNVENRIKDADKQGLDISTTKKLFDIAITAFEREDYGAAIQNLKEAQLTELLETKGSFNVLKFIINYWWAILVSLILLTVFSIIIYERIYLFVVSYKILYLSKEERNIISLIRDVQKQYYVKKEIDHTKYSNTIRQYNQNLTNIRQKRLELTSKKTALLTSQQALKSLNDERKNIVKAIKSCQKRYFITKTMNVARYNIEIQINQERLAEVNKNVEMLNAKIERERNLKLLKIKNNLLTILSNINLKKWKKKSKEDRDTAQRMMNEKIKRKIMRKLEKEIEKEIKKKKKNLKRKNDKKKKR